MSHETNRYNPFSFSLKLNCRFSTIFVQITAQMFRGRHFKELIIVFVGVIVCYTYIHFNPLTRCIVPWEFIFISFCQKPLFWKKRPRLINKRSQVFAWRKRKVEFCSKDKETSRQLTREHWSNSLQLVLEWALLTFVNNSSVFGTKCAANSVMPLNNETS